MKATVIKEVSIIMPVGKVLYLVGDNFLLKGHTKLENIEHKVGEETYYPPNGYPKERIEKMSNYFKIEND
jgi:hypothetical protein